MTSTLYREASRCFSFLDLKTSGPRGIALRAKTPEEIIRIFFAERTDSEQKQFQSICRSYIDCKKMEALGFRRMPCLGKPMNTIPYNFSGTLC